MTGEIRKPRVCMIVQQRDVKGGIASVTNGYYDSTLEDKYDIRYVESYCDGSAFKKLIKALKGCMDFRYVLGSFKPELVHMHSSFGPSFYRLQPFLFMARLRGIPVVNHCHGADFDTFYVKASDSKKRLIKKVFSKFDKVIVLSEEWKEKYREFVAEDKIVVIQNYCKPRPVEELSPLFADRFKAKQVLFLGEIGQRKGGFDFADIIRETSALIPDVRFVICGDGSAEDVEEIKSRIEKEKGSAQVFFPGWVRGEQKDELLRSSSVFILPSYQEGQPMSILDAMAYGLPVVSTEVGGIPQLISNGANGYLTKPGEATKMAEGIALILEDEERYEAISKESLKVAQSRGFEAHARSLSKVYDSVLR